MLLRRHASTSFGPSSDVTVENSAVPRGGSITIRIGIAILLLVSFAPLVAGVVMNLPPARVSASFGALSDTWTRLLSVVPYLTGQRPGVPAETIRPISHALSQSPAPVLLNAGDQNALTYGDRLKISFFESLGVELGGSSTNGNKDPVITIFPRMDLTAEYTVGEGGTVTIPRLGQFAAAGQSVEVLQSTLAAGFLRQFGRPTDVHIAVLERQPIYVIGTVRNAGSFRHIPGMTVLQALGNAGGTQTGSIDTSREIERIREEQRLRQADSRLERLLIQHARLAALRANADSLVLPPDIQSAVDQTTPGARLGSLIAEAETMLAQQRARNQQQRSLAERQVGVARSDLEAQTMRAEQLKILMGRKSERLRELEAIAARGSVPQFKLTDVSIEIAELTARHEDARVAMAQSERRLLEAEMALANLQHEQAVGVEKELAVTQQDIDDSVHAVTAMRAVVQVLRAGAPAIGTNSDGPPDLRITRRGPKGIVAIPATEGTPVMPGDVVQVNVAIHSGKENAETALKQLRN